MSIAAIQDELLAKARRLRWDLFRWVAIGLPIAIGLIDFYSGPIQSLPVSQMAWAGWLMLWILKGVWDVILDVSKKPPGALWVVWIVMTAIAYELPSHGMIMWVAMASLVGGSILAGGVDAPSWDVSAVVTAAGLWRGFDSAYFDNWIPLVGAIAAHSALSGIQDRFFKPDTLMARLKLVPVAAAWAACGGDARMAFALVSPHFVVYDAAKVLFCIHELSGEGVGGSFDWGARMFFFQLFGDLATFGRLPVEFARETEEVTRVMRQSSDKGFGVEHYLSLDAWDPIVPVESVNGQLWSVMRASFNEVFPRIRRKDAAGIVARHFETVEVGADFDSKTLHWVVAGALHELVFDAVPTDEERQLWIDCSMSVRQRVTLKGAGNPEVQRKALAKAAELMDDHSITALNASIILQPFIIGPLINISDTMVALEATGGDSIVKAMEQYPPFPLLERVHDGKHYFIESDRGVSPTTAAFGVGPRGCPGKALAMKLLAAVKKGVADRQLHFVPSKGHRFSGRLHDGADATSLKYPLKVIGKTLYRMIFVDQGNSV